MCIGLRSVCTVNNCHSSLYLNVGGLPENLGKTFSWSWKVLEFWGVKVHELCVCSLYLSRLLICKIV